MDGRDAQLTGEAPEQAAVAKAAELVAGGYWRAPGGCVGRRRRGAAEWPLMRRHVDPGLGRVRTPEITGTWPEGKAPTLAVGLAGATYELGKSAD